MIAGDCGSLAGDSPGPPNHNELNIEDERKDIKKEYESRHKSESLWLSIITGLVGMLFVFLIFD